MHNFRTPLKVYSDGGWPAGAGRALIIQVLVICVLGVFTLSGCAVSVTRQSALTEAEIFSPSTCLGHYDHENRGREPLYRSYVLPDCAAYVNEAEILVQLPVYHGNEPVQYAAPDEYYLLKLKRVVDPESLTVELRDEGSSLWELTVLKGDQQWRYEGIVLKTNDPHDVAGPINSHSGGESVLNMSSHALRLHVGGLLYSGNERAGMQHISLVMALGEKYQRSQPLSEVKVGLWQMPSNRWAWTQIDDDGSVYHCHKNTSGRVHQMSGKLIGNLFIWKGDAENLDPEIVKFKDSGDDEEPTMIEITEWGDYEYRHFKTYPVDDCDKRPPAPGEVVITAH